MKSKGPENETSFYCRHILRSPGPASVLGEDLLHSLFAWHLPLFSGYHCSDARSTAWWCCLRTRIQVPWGWPLSSSFPGTLKSMTWASCGHIELCKADSDILTWFEQGSVETGAVTQKEANRLCFVILPPAHVNPMSVWRTMCQGVGHCPILPAAHRLCATVAILVPEQPRWTLGSQPPGTCFLFHKEAGSKCRLRDASTGSEHESWILPVARRAPNLLGLWSGFCRLQLSTPLPQGQPLCFLS